MSIRRFVLGGLAAGLVSSLLGFGLAHLAFGDEVQALMERIGGLPAWAPLAHLAIRVAGGFAALWIHLGTCRLVAAPRRALWTAVAVTWALQYPVVLLAFHDLAVYRDRTLALVGLFGLLVEIPLEILAGRRVFDAGRAA